MFAGYVASQMEEYVSLAGYVVLLSAVTAGIAKYFERHMRFREHWLCSLIAWTPVALINVAYYPAATKFSLPPLLGTALVWVLCIGWAVFITKLAKWRYGIEKEGWFGLGAKVMLTLSALTWTMTGISYAISNLLT